LGISKSLLAFVWIAGPLSGTLVQPYVGIKSDRCRSPWGKRRPFIVGGAIATIISLVLLAWTKEIVRNFFAIFKVGAESQTVHVVSIVWAVSFIYILDFAINTSMSRSSPLCIKDLANHTLFQSKLPFAPS
jgi:solute carrier family 45 protein 1/2/4